MIVDDHEIFRWGLRDLINSIEGFQVVAEAGSCQDALTWVEQMHIDLVVLDMYLPDGDGIQVTRQLKRQAANPPCVIILSAMINDDTLVDAILAGADGYLTKDMPAGDILKSLKGFQRGQLALPRAVTTNLFICWYINLPKKKQNNPLIYKMASLRQIHRHYKQRKQTMVRPFTSP